VTEIPPATWPVKIDVSEFELALINIALNCRDAMPQDGIITITAENTRLRGDGEENLVGDFVALTIADTGCGIAADILPKVFDPFFTTKQRSKGTGLGLSQVHGFVHQSGGTVRIESELGKGTRITLYLPRAQANPEQAAAEPAAEVSTRGVVLLVEDNPDVAEVSAGLLERLGYEVHAAGDAQAALEALEARKFDLVVSDIVMAGALDGLGLARAIRQCHPDLPLILVTGYSNSAVLADPEFAVLRKPYQLEDLSRAAAKVIAESRQPPPSNLVRLRDIRRNANSKSERP
jgi:CheY-like chemotaxis protein